MLRASDALLNLNSNHLSCDPIVPAVQEAQERPMVQGQSVQEENEVQSIDLVVTSDHISSDPIVRAVQEAQERPLVESQLVQEDNEVWSMDLEDFN